ncbi:hypothetical protein NDU88_004946 [Pleurodeles waltl]|uniref:Uncharacterized protein n=1 Tax=Pleurodeles waltl TaxID=8319 RepID=A0AAV7LJM4_PLEWA|nr:hypothetical protein NDU88_004946 [Pleurodeles waltl]
MFGTIKSSTPLGDTDRVAVRGRIALPPPAPHSATRLGSRRAGGSIFTLWAHSCEVGGDKVGGLETPPMSFLREQMHGIAPRPRRCFQPRLTPAPGIHGTH